MRNICKAIGVLFGSGILFRLASQANAQDISEDDLRPHIKILASDEFEGREPGTNGGVKTAHYIAKQWSNAGYIGGAKDGGFYQSVPLISRIPQSEIVSYKKKGRAFDISSNEIKMVGRDSVIKSNIPIMFGGYGVKADGSVIDNVRGKAVFIWVDRPKFIKGKPATVDARTDALVKAGASTVIYIAPESASWERIRRFPFERPVSLQNDENETYIRGLASYAYVSALAKAGGVNWKKHLKPSEDGDFNGIDLGLTSSWNVMMQVKRYTSSNVIAKLPGKKPGAGSVFFTGHWDHLGICRPDSKTDRICNGAVDNASGMAVLIEVAKRLGKKEFDRDIYFVGTTAEESGLLGAYHLVDNAPTDIKNIVIALNVDTIAIAPKGSDVAIIGRGTTDLDPIIDKIVMDLGRGINSSTDANSFIRRQDGWALASKDVPALMVGGSFADMKLLNKFLQGDYHGVKDEYNEKMELGGAAEDANLHVKIAEYFANIATYSAKKAQNVNKASE